MKFGSDYFDENYFTVRGDRGWYDETAFALDNLWHRDFALYVTDVLLLARLLDQKPGTTVLDIGCARGNVVYWLRHLGYLAFGVDISEWAILNNHCLEYVRRADISSPNGHLFDFGFDIVLCREVLEHIDEAAVPVAIQNIADLLNPGGLAFLEVATNRAGKEEKKRANPENVDPSHITIHSLDWWRYQFEKTGKFVIDFERTWAAQHTGLGYRYGWDVMVLMRRDV